MLGYGIGGAGAVRAEQLVATPLGQRFHLVLPDGGANVDTALLGRYNISNLLAVAAVLHDAGVGVAEVARRLAGLTPPAGRMERLGGVGEPLVVVDYAHTPDALENVLVTLRGVAGARGGRLCVVFGCGGDRDKGKRPQMGEVAARLADQVLLTSDNPRSEDPARIIAEIKAGAAQAESEVDRTLAIRRAIASAADADVVLLAGKGHEAYQESAGITDAVLRSRTGAERTRSAPPGQAGGGVMNWLLSDIQDAIGGRLVGADPALAGVSTDTRAIAAGQLFVALRGERFDAHDFLDQAIAAGATALLVSDAARVPAGVPALVVDDTRIALGKLAAAWRARFAIPVIAVTGSNGKTTTKEMIAAILQAQFGDAVLATRGNLNNDIGLPLTLLRLDETHKAAVIEMGMNHPGEIAYLAPLGAPSVAVVTNAQRAHLEGMGDMDEVAREKGGIFSGLAADGIAVINADDRYAPLWREMAGHHLVRSFGIERAADVHAAVRQHGLETLLDTDGAGR